jgi:hypothetical protein
MPDTDLDELEELAGRYARREKAMLPAHTRGETVGFDYKPLLIPILAAVLASGVTLVAKLPGSIARQAVMLENQQKLLDELRQHTITRDTFDATIRPMQSDIADIKTAVEALHKARYDDDKTTYRTVRVIRASN